MENESQNFLVLFQINQQVIRFFINMERLFLKKNKRVLITITFVLENDNHKEVDFNGETLTFELQLIEVWTIK